MLDAKRLTELPAGRNLSTSSLVLALLITSPAEATYSIVAADATAREVGGAVTSCVAPQSVEIVYRSAPGHGAIHAQAAANTAGRDRGVALLEAGTSPADVIAQITMSAFDSRSQSRQYGVVDLSGRAAGFTGSSAQEYRADRQGAVGPYVYSIQGNILTGARVLDQAEAAFKTRGCDLAERLMLALEAGAENGEGDSRCTTAHRIPSDASSLQVDRAGEPAGSYLRLAFTSANRAPENPLVRLRADFDTWRMAHPCPGSSNGGVGGAVSSVGGAKGGGGSTSGAAGAAAVGGSLASGGAAGDASGAVGGRESGGAAGVASAGATSGGIANAAGGIGTGGIGVSGGANAGAPDTRGVAAGDDGGCGCRVYRGTGGRWSVPAAGAACVGFAWRRRKKAARAHTLSRRPRAGSPVAR